MKLSFAAVLGLAFVLIGGACAPTTRPPETKVAERPVTDAGAEAEEESEDVDGEAEAENEIVPEGEPSPCPTNMVLVATSEQRFCIDKYEASLLEVDGEGNEKPFPHWLPVDGHVVRAVSEPGVFPQGYISEVQAEDACAASGKRLCSHPEWKTACMGPEKRTFPYGDARQPGTCNDTGKSAVVAVFGARAYTDPGLPQRTAKPATASAKASEASTKSTSTKPSASGKPSSGATSAKPSSGVASAKPSTGGKRAHTSTKGRAAETTRARAPRPGTKPSPGPAPTKRAEKGRDKAASRAKRVPAKASTRPASVEPSVWAQLNDPRLGQVDGTLAKTGSHDACVNGWGAVDMVGNLHEWVKTDPSLVHGTFAGGYYLETALNGDGCQYRTTAHAHDYHDYSTGFRCCAEPVK